MTRLTGQLLSRLLVAVICFGVFAGCASTSAQSGRVRYDRAALDAMLAPIALYPDPLLSQVLMAASYPREVEEAAQWSRDRPGLTGDAAVRTSAGWDWDPSVRSLLAFPQVLDTMARHVSWTEDIGEAFLAQPEDVMETVQILRRRAYDNGTLRSTDQARVVDTGREILIEPVSAQIAHVPYYDPRVVYGSWWWPSRPPVYWAPWPGYVNFPGRPYPVYWGPGIRISTGFYFGNIIWPRREVHVVNTNAYYYAPRRVVVERTVDVIRPGPRYAAPRRESGPGAWQHDPSRRRAPAAREPERARATNEQRAPIAARPAEVRQAPASPPTLATPAPARPAGPATAPSLQGERRSTEGSFARRETAVTAPAPRAPERPIESTRPPRGIEQRVAPAAEGPQPQRRAERPGERDESRTVVRRDRDDPAPRTRSAQDGGRNFERVERDEPRTVAPRSRDDAAPRTRGAQEGPRSIERVERAELAGRQPERARGAANPGAGRAP